MNLPTARQSSRGLTFLIILLLGCLSLGYVGTSTVFAQADEAPMPDVGGDNGGGDAGGDDNKQDAAPKKPADQPKKSMFGHITSSVGWVFGIIFLSTSVILIFLVVLLAMDLRMGAAIPNGFVEDFTDIVNKRRFKEAYQIAQEDGSFLGRVLTAGMSRLQFGIEDARESTFNMVDSIKAGKDQLVAYLGVIGTLGPLLGLIGTVYGMIGTFRELGTSGGENVTEISSNIAKALVTTLFGVGLAMPAIFAHAFFRNRLIRLSMDTSYVADDLLTQMYHNSKKPGGPAPAPAPSGGGGQAPGGNPGVRK